MLSTSTETAANGTAATLNGNNGTSLNAEPGEVATKSNTADMANTADNMANTASVSNDTVVSETGKAVEAAATETTMATESAGGESSDPTEDKTNDPASTVDNTIGYLGDNEPDDEEVMEWTD